MNTELQAGQLVVCVDASNHNSGPHSHLHTLLQPGKVYRIKEILPSKGVRLHGVDLAPGLSFSAIRFVDLHNLILQAYAVPS